MVTVTVVNTNRREHCSYIVSQFLKKSSVAFDFSALCQHRAPA